MAPLARSSAHAQYLTVSRNVEVAREARHRRFSNDDDLQPRNVLEVAFVVSGDSVAVFRVQAPCVGAPP